MNASSRRHTTLSTNSGSGYGQSFRRALSGFGQSESGVMIIFAVYILVMILMVVGIGIDLMRFERDRAELQNTLDRAVLAAADLEQTLDPEEVVNDYFAKSNLGDKLKSVTLSQGLGYRSVAATAEAVVPTQFMHMTGLDSMTAPAQGTAEEKVGAVEISLVLDVSGSMAYNNRLSNLQTSAKQFVDTILAGSTSSASSISIIPYATQVNVGEKLLTKFNLQQLHDYSWCVNFIPEQFKKSHLLVTDELEHTAHFDPFTRSDGTLDLPVCPTRPGTDILPLTNNQTKLHNHIDAMTAGGNTSIDLGMKWGTALLDPAMRPVINTMIGAGLVPAEFSTRPMNYNDSDVLKVIVLMTDGANTTQYFVEDDHREGNSYIWWNQEAQRYSVYYPGYNAYYLVSHSSGDDSPRNRWADHPFGLDGDGCVYESGWVCGTQAQEGESVRLTYPELWAQTPVLANAEDNYYPWMNDSSAYSEWYSGVLDWVNSSTKDARTYTICDTAKDQDIIVFTIAFEAPYQGRTVLRECASSAAHYYNVSGLEISDAFSSIATSIRQLRLTQ